MGIKRYSFSHHTQTTQMESMFLEAKPPQPTQPWDHYWQSDRLASCGGAGGQNYQSSILRHWQTFFRHVVPDQAHILDICSGNGAIARIAADLVHSKTKRFQIDAFDSAKIDPDRFLTNPLHLIHFRGGINAEATPYGSATFDAIVGQYALEYTHIPRCLHELVRLGKSNTCIYHFVIHAREGIVVSQAAEQIHAAERLLGDLSPFDAAIRLVGSTKNAGSANAALSATLLARLRQITVEANQTSEPEMYLNIATTLHRLLSMLPTEGPETTISRIESLRTGLRLHMARLRAMLDSAIDSDAIQDLAHEFSNRLKRPVTITKLFKSERSNCLLGWVMDSRATSR